MKRYLIVLFLILCNKGYSTPPPSELLGFYQSFLKNNLYELSPYRGIIAHKNLLPKLAQSTDSNSLVSLFKLLFHQEADGIIMYTYNEPYRHFTPQTIGLLCASLYKKEISEDNNADLIGRIKKTFTQRAYPSRLIQFLKLIYYAYQEEQTHIHPSGSLYELLLGFLCQKYHDRKDLEEYVQILNKELELSLAYETSFSCDIPELLLCADTVGSSFELLVIHYHHYSGRDRYHPPPLAWQRDVQPSNKVKPFSDCCETALRALINEFLYDSEHHCFRLDFLKPEILKNVPLDIVEFYKNYQDAHTGHLYDSKQAHEQWARILSKIPNVQYRKERYEVTSHVSNFIRILSFLFRTPSRPDLDPAEQFVQWYQHSFKSDHTTCTITGNYHDDTNAEFIITLCSTPARTFSLHIQPEHAWLTQLSSPLISDTSFNVSHHLSTLNKNTVTRPLQDLIFLYSN